MNFLIDAQLPARLARRLAEAGHDAIHTSELPDANRTTDAKIVELVPNRAAAAARVEQLARDIQDRGVAGS